MPTPGEEKPLPVLRPPQEGGKMLADIRQAAHTAAQWRRIHAGRAEHAKDAKHNLEVALQRLENLANGQDAPELPFPDAAEDEGWRPQDPGSRPS